MTIKTNRKICASALAGIAMLAVPLPVMAQDSDESPRRTRIALGPQLVPSYPGSDERSIRPLIDFSRADEGEDFEFEAPDESFGFSVLEPGDFSFGPSVGLEGKRSSSDVGGALPDVGSTVELGGFAQLQTSENLRFRAEGRYGVSGHNGFIGIVSADYAVRDGDKQLLSVGPRVTITDSNYQNTYFGVLPQDAAVSGLTAYDADGGVQAIGATVGYIRQFTPHWGIYSYAKYDRLMGDPADSPVVETFGSRDQFSGGLGLTYTFGRSAP